VLSIIIGGGIGFYDGIFGPGTATFLIFLFIRYFAFDFLQASASAKFVNIATNVAALMFFYPVRPRALRDRAAHGRLQYARLLYRNLGGNKARRRFCTHLVSVPLDRSDRQACLRHGETGVRAIFG
jgi:hypothetical protein